MVVDVVFVEAVAVVVVVVVEEEEVEEEAAVEGFKPHKDPLKE